MKRCFVISPIDQEGSQIRAHADDVFDYIIKPALEECGIEAWRSDHLHEPGKISDQMFRAILHEDLCIALLTGNNPNVFYELAVAQCAGRPVIIMAERGQELPFDIKDMRCVYYDLSPRPLFDKTYVKQVVAHVKSLEASGWQSVCPFEGFASIARGTDAQIKYVPRSLNYRNVEQWNDLLHNTESIFEIMGTTPDQWLKTKNFEQVIAQKAKAGCKIRVLIMDEANPMLSQLINRKLTTKSYESAVMNVREILRVFLQLASETPGMEVRSIKNGALHFRLTITDQLAVLRPYFYAEKSDFSPVWEAQVDTSLYALAREEFESLWQTNETSAVPGPS